ncbi:MAG: hypothetical protein HQL82_06065 [Magnetococcales bacterium]|nr:hypothetical protein [Magnetococcales bacterium]
MFEFRADAVCCPVCEGHPGRIYRCTHCGEVRCGLATCTGSQGGQAAWAGSGVKCRNCGPGRYRVLDYASHEMDLFLREYRDSIEARDILPRKVRETGDPPSSGFRKYRQPETGWHG